MSRMRASLDALLRLAVLLLLLPVAAQGQIAFRGASQGVSVTAPAPAFQLAGTAVSGTGSVTPAWPAHQADDVALLFIESTGGQAANLSVPAGFAPVLNSPQSTGTGTNGTRLTVYWARATSTSMPSPTVADPGNHVYAQILTYRSVVKAGDPWDVTGGGVKASASTSVTVTGVTTTVTNTLIVQAVARDNDSGVAAFSAQTNANLTGIIERSDAGTTSGNGGGFAVWDGVLAAAGATGNTTATVTSSINAFLTIALKSPEESLTIAKPAGTVQDDVMIASIAVRPDTLTINPPSGWALVRRIDNASANANSLAVYVKVAGAAEPAIYSWGIIPSSTGAVGGIQSFSSVDTVGPIIADNGQNTASGLNHATPSVATTVPNAVIVTSHAFSSAATWTPPAGMTEAFDVASLAVPNAGGIALAGSYFLQSAVGASGAKTATASNDADVGNAHILALRPAPSIGAIVCASDNGGNSTLDLTGVDLTGRNGVVVFVGYNNDGFETVSSVVIDPGGASQADMGAALAAANQSDDAQIYIFGMVNPPQGIFTIRATFSSSLQGNRGSNICVYPLSNVDTAAPFGTAGTNAATSAGGNVTVASAIGELVLAGLAGETIGPSTVAAPAVEDADVQGGSGGTVHHLATARRGGAGPNVTISWGHANDHWAAAAISVRFGGGPPPPGSFNAFETSTAAAAITGVIRTRVAGAAFSLDVVAIQGSAQLSGFTDQVVVELLGNNTLGVALDAENCPTSFTLVQTVAPNPTITGGRSAVNFAAVADSWRDVRVRVRWPTSSPTVSVCSTDNFAIRPDTFASFAMSDTNWTTAGTTRTLIDVAFGAVTHKAGQPFSVRAQAVNAAGTPAVTANYTGSPVATLSACGGGACTATQGALTLSTAFVAGQLVSDVATYNEVGAFRVQLTDDTFATVDSADSSLAERRIESAAIDVGRFVPDHFAVSLNAPSFTTGCGAGNFTYLGQTFGYGTQPVITVEARNAANNTTTLYAGAWWRITNASLTGKSYSVAAGAFDTSGEPGVDPVVASAGGGTGTLTFGSGTGFLFTRTTPVLPFDAEVSLAINVIDTDGVAYASNPARFGSPSVGNGIAFTGGKEMRFGRLRIANANGSTLVPLTIGMEAQHWLEPAPGKGYFVTNTGDTCTLVTATNIALDGYRKNLNACETSITVSGFTGGRATVRLSPPGAGNDGSVALTANLGAAGSGSTCIAGVATPVTGANRAYLQGNWTGGAYDQNPAGRATFGAYRGGEETIFQRENF